MESSGTDGKNATAKNLAEFMQSVSDYRGYYIARYEASYGSGSSVSDYKPLSKPSKGYSEDSMNYSPGTLWNFVTQSDAAQVSRNMYSGNKDIQGNTVGVESDLVNSYAWDTAIVYIQEMEDTNYANATIDLIENTILMNTGETGDVVCNVYDMAANLYEWTTEYSTFGVLDIGNIKNNNSFNKFSRFVNEILTIPVLVSKVYAAPTPGEIHPCVTRGGSYYDINGGTAKRLYAYATDEFYDTPFSFRTVLYVCI